MHQREGAGAVGRFDHAGPKAALADQRRLLVAGDPGDRDRRAEQLGCRLAEIGGGVASLGQQRPRNVEPGEQLRIPFEAVQVEQHRARCVGDVGLVPRTAGQPPQEERVDRAEGDVAGDRPLAQPRNGVEQPADFRCRKIGVDDEARALGDRLGKSLRAPALADRRGAAVLPDDGVVHRLAAGALPQNRRLALVGDADRGDGRGRCRDRLAAGGDHCLPDFLGIVLDPAGLRIDLAQLTAGDVVDRARRIEQDRAGAGGALVDRENQVSRFLSPSNRHQALPLESPNRYRVIVFAGTECRTRQFIAS